MRARVTAFCLMAAALAAPLGMGKEARAAVEVACKPIPVICEEFDIGWYRLFVCIKLNPSC